MLYFHHIYLKCTSMPVFRLLILFLSVAFALTADAQTFIIESLKKKIEQTTNDEEKIRYIFRLCEENQSMSNESYRNYVTQAITLSAKLQNEYYIDQAKAEHAFTMAKDQKIDTALNILNALLIKYEKTENRGFISKLLTLKGRVLDRGFRRVDNIDVNLQKLQECERYSDTMCIIMAMNSMAWSYLELEKPQEALSWLRKALQLNYSNKTALKKYNCLYSNTALAFHRLGNLDSAMHYIGIAIKFGREAETLTFLSNSLSFQAKILMKTPQTEVAKTALNEALEIRKQIGDPYYILFNLVELADFYTYEKNYTKSIELCKEAISIAYLSGISSKLPEIYQLLADNYEATGNTVENIRSLKQLIFIKDSLYNTYTASLNDIETKYEVQKKENVIIRQKLDLTKKNYFLYGSLILLLVVIVSAYFIFKANRKRNKLKMQVMQEEEKRIASLAVTEAEEAERKRIAADLHDNLGAQANAILYSTELLQQESEEKEILFTDLHDTAKDMLTSLRETLWALKNTEVTATDIWIRLINFTKQLGRHYPQVKISAEGIAPDFTLSSTRALNIVFIIQEAVNNAVRHSEASLINIVSEYTDNVWKVEVIDNGKGFDMEAANKKLESYGLSNMTERAAAAGGMITIETGKQKGTRIELELTN